MSDKIKKIDKEYVLTDSSLNSYGFRLLTSGYQLDKFQKNPIGYYMHERETGVVLKWQDLRMEGDKVVGKPCINLSNPRGQQCADEIENGFLNGASVGGIVALEYTEDAAMMLPGQTGPTVTKWYNKECSICDVPGNMNALTLFDKEGNQINLSDFTIKKLQTSNMKEIKLSADQLSKIPGLKAEASQEDFNQSLANLIAEVAKVPQLMQDLSSANTAKKKAEDDFIAYKKSVVDAEVINLVDSAVKETRCTRAAGELLKKQYEGKPDELKALLSTMNPYSKVSTADLNDGDVAELNELSKLSGAQLFAKEGAFERLKVLDLSTYKRKYKEQFGEEPTEDKK